MSKEKTNGYLWNIAAGLGTERQMSISGNFSIGASAAEINAEVDKIISVVNRQQAKAAAIAVKQEIDSRAVQLKSAIDDLERIDKKAETKGGPTTLERGQREAAVVHVGKLQDDLKYKTKVLEELQNEAK
jgi:hypothetical protein